MKKLFCFFAVLAITLVSCNMNENLVVDEPPTITDPEALYAKTEYNFDMRDFAMAVNEAINTNKSFRKLVKEDALVQFDGDYNFLLSHVAEKEIAHNDVDNGIDAPNKAKSNFRVRDMLEDAFYTLNEKNELRGARAKRMISKENGLQNSSASQTIIDELMEKYPLLQIAVPVHIEDLEDENYIPPVTFIPEEYDEYNTEYVLGFKQDGIIVIGAVTEPDNAVIVIGINERLHPASPGANYTAPPPTPTNLAARVIESGILLTWNMPAGTDASSTLGYRVFRKKLPETNYTHIATPLGHANRDFADQDVIHNQTYSYYVVAFNDDNVSDISNYDTITAPRPPGATSFSVVQEGIHQACLKWAFPLDQYSGNVKISKRNMGYGGAASYTPVVTLPTAEDAYFDTNITPGQQSEYKLVRETGVGESMPAYDFIYTPYRDISRESQAIIKRIKHSDIGAIEGWLCGKPEFKVKIAGVKDGKTTILEPGETYIQMKHRNSNQWSEVNIDDGMILRYWKPSKWDWYDCISLHFTEDDSNFLRGSSELVFFAVKVAKSIMKDPITGVILDAVLEKEKVDPEKFAKWLGGEDEEIGYAYLYYYEDPNRQYIIDHLVDNKRKQLTIQFGDK